MRQWPVREGLIALVAQMQDAARREYELAQLQYVIMAAAGGKSDPPRLPRILERDP